MREKGRGLLSRLTENQLSVDFVPDCIYISDKLILYYVRIDAANY